VISHFDIDWSDNSEGGEQERAREKHREAQNNTEMQKEKKYTEMSERERK